MGRLAASCFATVTLLLVSCSGPDDAVRTAATSSPEENTEERSAPSLSTPSTSDGDPVRVDEISPRSCGADELQPRLAGPTQDVTAALGEPIRVAIVLENTTSERCARPTEWSMTVTNSDGVEVITITTLDECLDPCELLPGEQLTLAEEWNQIGFDDGEAQGNLGKQYKVGPGEYALDVTVRLPGLPAGEGLQRFRRTVNVDAA